MGFLDSIFGNKKPKETALLRADMESMRAQFLKNSLETKNDINQIIDVLADLDQELRGVQANIKANRESENLPDSLSKTVKQLEAASLKNDEVVNALKERIGNMEKTAGVLKIMGRLSIKNYDALKLLDSKTKRFDALEKSLLEHIKSTPESVVSKDDYFEELRSLKKRLGALEINAAPPALPMEENILIRPGKKKQKKQ